MTDTDQREASQSAPEPDLEALRARIHDLLPSLADHTPYDRLINALANLQNTIAALAAEIARLKADWTELQADASAQIERLDTKVDERDQEIARLKDDNRLLTECWDTSVQVQERSEAEITRLKNRIQRERDVFDEQADNLSKRLAEQAERYREVVEAANTVAAYLYSVVNPGTIPTSVRVAMDRIPPTSLDQASPAGEPTAYTPSATGSLADVPGVKRWSSPAQLREEGAE